MWVTDVGEAHPGDERSLHLLGSTEDMETISGGWLFLTGNLGVSFQEGGEWYSQGREVGREGLCVGGGQ
jgi:hypothetical protein